MNLTEKDVREILKLLDESGYDELKLETDNFKLTLRQSAGSPATVESGAPAPAAPVVEPPTLSEPVSRQRSGGRVHDVFPPLPGTFYRAPSPGAEPFVEVGAVVGEDTVVGLVETMKLMNPVTAGCSGEVIEICVENGALIDAHDVVLRIREI